MKSCNVLTVFLLVIIKINYQSLKDSYKIEVCKVQGGIKDRYNR